MKKIILFVVFLGVLFSGEVYATTGGPSFLSEFRYNPSDESVYFVSHDNSGRGCPPSVHRISLVDKVQSSVFSCEQGEEFRIKYAASYEALEHKIQSIVSNLKILQEINLQKNNIQILVEHVRDERNPLYAEMYPDGITSRIYSVNIYQNGKIADNFQVSGCYVDQPFVFAGYSIPGFNKKMAILTSGLGHCFEGGYILETMHVIGGIDLFDKDDRMYTHKQNSPLIPNRDTIVVKLNDKNATPVDSKVSSKDATDLVPTTETSQTDNRVNFYELLIRTLIRYPQEFNIIKILFSK